MTPSLIPQARGDKSLKEGAIYQLIQAGHLQAHFFVWALFRLPKLLISKGKRPGGGCGCGETQLQLSHPSVAMASFTWRGGESKV